MITEVETFLKSVADVNTLGDAGISFQPEMMLYGAMEAMRAPLGRLRTAGSGQTDVMGEDTFQQVAKGIDTLSNTVQGEDIIEKKRQSDRRGWQRTADPNTGLSRVREIGKGTKLTYSAGYSAEDAVRLYPEQVWSTYSDGWNSQAVGMARLGDFIHYAVVNSGDELLLAHVVVDANGTYVPLEKAQPPLGIDVSLAPRFTRMTTGRYIRVDVPHI